MEKSALMIFARNPVAGKVKTRLAKDVGPERALKIYKMLLEKTYLETRNIDCQKFLFLSDFPDSSMFDQTYTQEIQYGNDIGERMENAFKIIFGRGFGKILVAGTDCPGLNPDIVNGAFEKLNTFDIVAGPATDGGYYLLGLKEINETLFTDIKWSSEEVLNQTVKKIKSCGLSYFLLKELNDIDEAKDLVNFNQLNLSNQNFPDVKC